MKQKVTWLTNERIKLNVVSFSEKRGIQRVGGCLKVVIMLPSEEVIGRCDLRIGHKRKTFICGNIGYEIDKVYQENHFSYDARLLMFSLAK